MGQGHSTAAFVVIVVLYAVIGLMSVAGAVAITRRLLGPRAEQIFYGLFLVMIAAFYLAFTAYFGIATAWRLETAAVLAFAVMGLMGARLPLVLIVGYLVHGLWDLAHELEAHGAFAALEPGRLTAIPLAYGIFCAAFDVGIVAYFFTRRAEWGAAWTVTARSG